MAINRDKLNALKDLANLRIEDIFDELGIVYQERYNYIVACCPIHGGDRQDAFSYLLERGIWKCFSRGCDKTHGSDIVGLVRGVKECGFSEAVQFLKGFVNLSLSDKQVERMRDQRENREFIESQKRKKHVAQYYPTECLTRLKYHKYLETRGYPRWLIEKYQIGACLQSGRYMSNRIVVPVINREGKIAGFTGRTLDPDWQSKNSPKWKHSKGAWISYNLFNINFAAPYVSETGTVVLCEGPLDVLRLEQAGVHNSVAVLGKKFYSGQMSILIGMGATRILDALDNDAAGKAGSRGIMKEASCLFDIEKVNIPEEYKDIGEMDISDIKTLFSSYEAALE